MVQIRNLYAQAALGDERRKAQLCLGTQRRLGGGRVPKPGVDVAIVVVDYISFL